MKKSKLKFLSLFLAALCLLSLVSCGPDSNGDDTQNTNDTHSDNETHDTNDRTGINDFITDQTIESNPHPATGAVFIAEIETENGVQKFDYTAVNTGAFFIGYNVDEFEHTRPETDHDSFAAKHSGDVFLDIYKRSGDSSSLDAVKGEIISNGWTETGSVETVTIGEEDYSATKYTFERESDELICHVVQAGSGNIIYVCVIQPKNASGGLNSSIENMLRTLYIFPVSA